MFEFKSERRDKGKYKRFQLHSTYICMYICIYAFIMGHSIHALGIIGVDFFYSMRSYLNFNRNCQLLTIALNHRKIWTVQTSKYYQFICTSVRVHITYTKSHRETVK